MSLPMFKKADRVFDIRYGWGIVHEVSSGNKYPVKVLFLKEVAQYTKSGRDYEGDEIGLLRHYEYKLCQIANHAKKTN